MEEAKKANGTAKELVLPKQELKQHSGRHMGLEAEEKAKGNTPESSNSQKGKPKEQGSREQLSVEEANKTKGNKLASLDSTKTRTLPGRCATRF